MTTQPPAAELGQYGAEPRPMRVLLSTDAVGGVWDYALELAGGLAAAGHAVRLAVLGRPTADRLRRLPETVDVVTGDYRLEWMAGADEDIDLAGEWLARSAREWDADVVHLNQMAYSGHDFGAPTLAVVHSDVRSWYSEVRGMAAPPEWDVYAARVTEGLRAADVVVVPSAYQAELTARHYGRKADAVIHNGIRPPARHRADRRAPVVVSVGRAWDEAKGMAVLDAAAGLLGDSAPEVHVIGERAGPHSEVFIARHARALGRLPREEVDVRLGRAALYVAASLYEPFGLAPLEAAFHQTALLLSDIGSFRELWDGCALFVPARDASALAAGIAELTADHARREALGHAARERALERYTADSFVAAYLDLYSAMRLQLEAKPSCA